MTLAWIGLGANLGDAAGAAGAQGGSGELTIVFFK